MAERQGERLAAARRHRIGFRRSRRIHPCPLPSHAGRRSWSLSCSCSLVRGHGRGCAQPCRGQGLRREGRGRAGAGERISRPCRVGAEHLHHLRHQLAARPGQWRIDRSLGALCQGGGALRQDRCRSGAAAEARAHEAGAGPAGALRGPARRRSWRRSRPGSTPLIPPANSPIRARSSPSTIWRICSAPAATPRRSARYGKAGASFRCR